MALTVVLVGLSRLPLAVSLLLLQTGSFILVRQMASTAPPSTILLMLPLPRLPTAPPPLPCLLLPLRLLTLLLR